MKYNELTVSKTQNRKRVGRGISAGQGKTAGRGTKGQKARTGHSKLPAGFMGGQRAIMQAIPKLKGFKSLHDKAQVVYTGNLNELSGKVDNFVLADAQLIANPYAKVKIISNGDVTAKIDLETQFASKTAIEAIKKAGGSFKKLNGTEKLSPAEIFLLESHSSTNEKIMKPQSKFPRFARLIFVPTLEMMPRSAKL